MTDAPSTRPRLLRFVLAPAAAALVALALGIGIGSGFLAGGAGPTGMSDDEFDRRVRDFLLNNPDVLVQAIRGTAPDAQPAAGTQSVREHADALLNDPASPLGGNPDGDVTIVEFFDYNCPYCRSVMPMLAQALDADGGIRFVYKDWPILGPGSEFAAKAALAAHKQGKYAAFHDTLMTGGAQATEARVLEVAGTIGLDLERLKRDMEGDDVAQAIQRTFELARALGITGTPSFVIGDEIVRGAVGLRVLQASVAAARESTTGLP